MSLETPVFIDKAGREFRGVTLKSLLAVRQKLASNYGITPAQISEAASYSLAMVVRFALGLSAMGGKVCTIVTPSLAGETALGCLRHLVNAGSEGIVFIDSQSQYTDNFSLQLTPLKKMGVKIHEKIHLNDIQEVLPSCHNLILGLFSEEGKTYPSELIDCLNEAQTPVHAIECPLGISPDSGQTAENPIFASSTLSLGAPYSGLFYASEHVGRHYLCDISIPPALYKEIGDDFGGLFSEQPVIQIFPKKEPEPSE